MSSPMCAQIQCTSADISTFIRSFPLREFIIPCKNGTVQNGEAPLWDKAIQDSGDFYLCKNLYLSRSKTRQVILFLHWDERSDWEKWKIWPGWVVITVAETKSEHEEVRWQKIGTKTCHHKLKQQSQYNTSPNIGRLNYDGWAAKSEPKPDNKNNVQSSRSIL